MSTTTLYVIKDWSEHYENNRTRELKRMLWVPIPTSLDGDGYTELVVDHPDGAAHYGIWVGCVIVASGCDPRGTLLRGTKKPFCASSLSRVLRMPEHLVSEALKRFVSIGWMETQVFDVTATCVNPAGASHLPATFPQVPALNGRDGMEGMEGRKGKASKNPTSAQGAAPLDRGSTDLDRSGSESGFDVSIVTGETLRSLDRLRAWYRHDLTRPDSIVEDSEEFFENVITAAAKAITAPSVRDEIAVFKWLVKGRNWEYLNATYEEIARAMKRKSNPRPPPSVENDEPMSLVKALADNLALKKEPKAAGQPR